MSVVYAGCAPAAAHRPAAGRAQAAPLRVWLAEPASVETVMDLETTLPYAPRGLFAGCTGKAASCGRWEPGGCVRFEVDPRARYASGLPVFALDVVEAWEQGRREPDGPHPWLLAPLVGLRADRGALELCFESEPPDLDARLDHPSLRLHGPMPAARGGPGPYERTGPRTLALVREGPARPIAAVEFLDGAGDPAALFRAGDLDLGVLYGPAAASLLAEPASGVRAERAPGWDRTFALWLVPRGRWLGDPAFRRWLGSIVDAGELLELLFAGQGRVATALSAALPPSQNPSRTARPFGPGSAPQVRLAVDHADVDALRIASRIKAVAESHGLELQLEGLGDPADAEAVLLVHRPALPDAVLAIQDTLWPVRGAAADALEALAQAARGGSSRRRARAAAAVERDLVGSGRLVPLVTLEAWRFRDVRLRMAAVDGWGRLGLSAARWSR